MFGKHKKKKEEGKRQSVAEYPWQMNEDRKDNKMYDNDDKRHNDMGET